MKVTLVRPPAYSTGFMGAQLVPVLGIAYVAAAVREAGHSVDIVDMCGEEIEHAEVTRGRYVAYGMPFSRLKSRLRPSDVFGFTCMFSQDWVFHRELMSHVRALYPESTFVAGGEHISALPEYCLHDSPALDICVVGEGEHTFTALLDAIQAGDRFDGIPGLVYRPPGGKGCLRTPEKTRIRDLDDLPLPAWDLIPMENYLSRSLNYHIKRGRTIPVLASRGCPYRCSFCSNPGMWGSPWIPRKPKAVVDEMELYTRLYGAENFVFSDLTAAIKQSDIVKLCNEIMDRGLQITWQLPTVRTEALDADVLKLMHRAGCRDLDFAIESASAEVLRSVGKKSDPERIASLITDGLRAGMNLSTNIIIGLPREGLGDFWKTYCLLLRLAATGLHEVNVFPFVPYPGSKLFEEFLAASKIQLRDRYFLSLFAYADLGQAVSWSERFGPRTLSLMRLAMLISFYGLMFLLHPARILRFAMSISRGAGTTKLEGVLGRVMTNLGISFFRTRLRTNP